MKPNILMALKTLCEKAHELEEGREPDFLKEARVVRVGMARAGQGEDPEGVLAAETARVTRIMALEGLYMGAKGAIDAAEDEELEATILRLAPLAYGAADQIGFSAREDAILRKWVKEWIDYSVACSAPMIFDEDEEV